MYRKHNYYMHVYVHINDSKIFNNFTQIVRLITKSQSKKNLLGIKKFKS